METEDDQGKQAEQGGEEALGDGGHGADELVRGEFVHELDEVDALGTVAVALVDGVHAQEAGPTVGLRSAPFAYSPGADDNRALPPIDAGAT